MTSSKRVRARGTVGSEGGGSTCGAGGDTKELDTGCGDRDKEKLVLGILWTQLSQGGRDC